MNAAQAALEGTTAGCARFFSDGSAVFSGRGCWVHGGPHPGRNGPVERERHGATAGRESAQIWRRKHRRGGQPPTSMPECGWVACRVWRACGPRLTGLATQPSFATKSSTARSGRSESKDYANFFRCAIFTRVLTAIHT
jgi:hypothetical protein